MIEQLHYATTSRYNFPQIFEELDLTRRLTDLSLGSMHGVKGRLFRPFEAEFLEPFAESLGHNEPLDLKGKAISALLTPLKPIQEKTPVVGIDVSSMRIGETETGVICAVRGAVVWNEGRRYHYLRVGPFPFQITEENKREIFGELEENRVISLSSSVSPLSEAHGRLCNSIERWIQLSICHSITKGVVLWDGSLSAGTSGNSVSHILRVARRNCNSVLAFSKTTSVRFLGWRITDLILKQKPPCLFEVEGLPLSISKGSRLLAKIYVAKLAEGGCSFRLDIDRALPREDGIAAVERLLGNDILFQGYPETLRLAHIYSTFTANDVIGIQRFLTQEYGLRVITRHNIRKALFGPYGTGFED